MAEMKGGGLTLSLLPQPPTCALDSETREHLDCHLVTFSSLERPLVFSGHNRPHSTAPGGLKSLPVYSFRKGEEFFWGPHLLILASSRGSDSERRS